MAASGIPFTIFRCTMFMETLPMYVRDGKAMVMGRQPHRWRWIAAQDYAAMVVRALAVPEADAMLGAPSTTVEARCRQRVQTRA